MQYYEKQSKCIVCINDLQGLFIIELFVTYESRGKSINSLGGATTQVPARRAESETDKSF